LKSDLRSLGADVASDILSTRKELSEQIVGLRHAAIEYHTSIISQAHAPHRAAATSVAPSDLSRAKRQVVALFAAA
jgi:hypothetical protein